jgi:8-oxo-dGTP pyrophosphatase MutT (NUDIX family)
MENYTCSTISREKIRANLNHFTRYSQKSRDLRRAAVCLTLVDYRNRGNLQGLETGDDQSLALILTRRAGNLRKHPGQWALPGGSMDKGETPVQAACRELEEEVGLCLPENQVLGYLDDFVTRSGFHITPVVFWAGRVERLRKNPQEVSSIHRIPCSEFFRKDAPLLESGVENSRPILYMPVGHTCIASPTAAIIFQFREAALCGRSTRVYHYDQPYFAWN